MADQKQNNIHYQIAIMALKAALRKLSEPKYKPFAHGGIGPKNIDNPLIDKLFKNKGI